MKLGMQVGLAPGHIVLDRDPTHPPANGHSPPIFRPYLLWPNGIKMPLGMDVGLSLSDIVLDWNLAPLPKKGGRAPNFRHMFIVAKQLDGSR